MALVALQEAGPLALGAPVEDGLALAALQEAGPLLFVAPLERFAQHGLMVMHSLVAFLIKIILQ